MKLKKSVKITILVVMGILLISLGVYLVIRMQPKKETVEAPVVEKDISAYGYQLTSNQTDLYKQTFDELETILTTDPVDEKAYVECITKLFVMDFYHLANKRTNQDIGGVQFVHSDIRENFILKANSTDGIYHFIESNIYGDRDQELPEVTGVEIEEVTNESFEYNDTVDENAYVVKATWTYAKDLGYETEKTFVFVHETEQKLALVEMR